MANPMSMNLINSIKLDLYLLSYHLIFFIVLFFFVLDFEYLLINR